MISTNTHSQLQKETIKFLTELIEKGGLEPYEYQAFTDIVNHLKPAQVDPFTLSIIFIHIVRKTSSLQGLDIRTNLLIFDILFDNTKRCTSTGGYEIAG